VGRLIGLACRAADDEEGARLDLDASREELERLGASADLSRRVEHALARQPSADLDGLTIREVQVLKLFATGVTNRAIAAELVISERTVATHVGSILRKLSLPSRAAATGYAHERHLLSSRLVGVSSRLGRSTDRAAERLRSPADAAHAPGCLPSTQDQHLQDHEIRDRRRPAGNGTTAHSIQEQP